MLNEHTPIWVWDGYWWPAFVVSPVIDLEGDTMLVRFENGVTAPIKASAVRYRDPAHPHPPSNNHRVVSQPSRSSVRPAETRAVAASGQADLKLNSHSV
ncbi:MAG TPA: hypothetical protein VJ728_15880 [Candidatus Binataceae bacterium]|nr:hypothetical protein [Candidatus Binataceae bacterium]